ncbi:TauD/TfdA family dioxygenase [Streptomyces prunicolor]|uniref:TauD/TfdA family dioxygenase n=1 Tax=Streptomyces prunicolor TaxID=67348 RepID=UPI00037FA694|nr:TauD/TfdA family dioxygenase [Streptomyces prunicolor]
MPTPLIDTPVSATTELPDFSTGPAAVVETSSWSLPDTGVRRRVAAEYRRRGYVIVDVPGSTPTHDDLAALSGALGLGRPFTPPLYAGSAHTVGGVSRLTAVPDAAHPFQGAAGQNVHCDGTLQQLGEIPTTVMMCAAEAADGGLSYLVDLVDAYAELRRLDPEAAAQLAHPEALVRTSTLVDGQSVTAPAFAEEHPGTWITRFSRTATDAYRHLPGQRDALDRALAMMDAAAMPGSSYRVCFTLHAGQALVLANDRLGHGRTAYRDDPACPRLLLRGLFTRRPLA